MKRKIRCGGKPMTAIVLAGGRGRRMKADKASLDVGGRTLLEHVLAQVEPYFDEVLISISRGRDIALAAARRTRRLGRQAPARAKAPQLRIVPDETPGLGPIGGLLAGLKGARNDVCAVVACDIPEIDQPLLRSLARAAASVEIAVGVDPAGRYEPLFAVYRRSIIPAIESLLARGEFSLLPLYKTCRTSVVALGDKGGLCNLNTRADYESYIRSIKGE
ncbi:MAG TPA: molybdenum cofactor guanylyltransferase [Acidobacteriota bacterium]|nr:molybdenum cofactor guanylyltransferase [Acidobacteriota bacterium]